MAKFTTKQADGSRRQWSIEITVGAVKRLKASGYNVLAMLEDGAAMMQSVLTDPAKLAEILWVLVEKQASGVEPEQFADSLDGQAVVEAADALFESLGSFFPNQTQRAALLAIWTKTKQIDAAQAEAVTTKARDMSVSSLVGSAASTGSPESLGSNPTN